MKKKILTAAAVLSCFALAGCNSKKTDTEASSSSSSAAESSSSTSQSSAGETAASSTAESSKEETSAPSTSEQADKVLAEVASEYPNDTLPTSIMTASEAPYLTAATTGASDQSNFKVLYYAEDSPIAVNDSKVNSLSPIASYEKKTYASADEAIQAINAIEPSGSTVDLGYGITGYRDAGAGNVYIGWVEGNWRISVHASNIQGEDAEPLAKQAVEYFESAYLPAPEQAGQIRLEVSNGDYQHNSVTWQSGAAVYTVTHGEAMQAVKMAASISQ